MTRLALIHPSGLMATEIRETLDRRRDLWQELSLLSNDDDDIGGLTEVRGEAAMISRLDGKSLNAIDVAIFSGDIEASRPLLKQLPSTAKAILMAEDAEPSDGHPVVAGVNLESASAERQVLLSPHPGAVGLAHLLAPLKPFRPQRMAATLLQPISMHGREGLDEMFEQTRSILAFSAEPPRQVFPAQMAFNILPTGDGPRVVELLRSIVELQIPMSVQLLQVATFHSFCFSLHFEIADDPGPEALAKALAEHPFLDLATEPDLLGPVDAAARDEVLVGLPEAIAGQPGHYRLWAVMDNLTCGGALNALHLLEAIAPSSASN